MFRFPFRVSKPSAQGFTLIQVSVILTLAALAMVAFLPSSQSNLTNDSITTARMNAILVALRNYEVANGVLPSPADASVSIHFPSYGHEMGWGGDYYDLVHGVMVGMVPVRTLGLSNDYAVDAFGRYITYAVDQSATSCWSSTSLPGQIVVMDNGVPTNTVAVLVSHGPDGHGAWLPFLSSSGNSSGTNRLNAGITDNDTHLVNAHGLTGGGFPAYYSNINMLVTTEESATTQAMFVRKPPVAGAFDDIVVYKNPYLSLNTISAVNPYATVSIANGIYNPNMILTFTVTFPSPVTVNISGGTPFILFKALGNGSVGSYNVASPNYYSGSGTNTLTFRYTAISTDNAPAGNGIFDPEIIPNQGTISTPNICLQLSNFPNVFILPTFYIADEYNNRIRTVTAAGGKIATYAGSGSTAAYSGDGSAATLAQLNYAAGVALDSSGNVYIADYNNQRIREVIASTGNISTIAGSASTAGFGGDGSAATLAQLSYPTGVALDSSGNLYIADQQNNRIRKVLATSGNISTIAGNGAATFGGDGGLATSAQLNYPAGVTFDKSGNLYIADSYNQRIREVLATSSIINTVAGSNTTGGYSGDGTAATLAQLNNPLGVTVDSSGNLYIADEQNNRVRKVLATSGKISTIAGNGVAAFLGDSGQATQAEINYPAAVALDSSGNLYIVDQDNQHIRKVATSGVITTIAGSATTGGFSGDAGNATTAKLNMPSGIAISTPLIPLGAPYSYSR